MKKRMIAAVLALACIVSLFAACANEKPAEEKTPAELTAEETALLESLEINDVSATKKQINFYRDGLKIYSELYLPEGEGPFPAVIFAGGLRATYTSLMGLAKDCAKNGVAGLVFDFTNIYSSTQSKSDGEGKDLTILTEAADLDVLLEGMRVLPYIDRDSISLFGYSFGGLAAAYCGSEHPDEVKSMVLVEPSFQGRDQMRELFPSDSDIPDFIPEVQSGRCYADDLFSFDIYEKISAYKGNVLIIKATEAPSIGGEMPEYLDRAAETFPSAKLVAVEGANHMFEKQSHKDEMKRLALEFILENVG